MEKQCVVCEYRKDEGPKRLRELENQMIAQINDGKTTNIILGRIEKSLIAYIEISRDDIKENSDAIKVLSPESAVLKDRSNVQRKLNYKALGWLIALIGFFGSVIASIITTV